MPGASACHSLSIVSRQQQQQHRRCRVARPPCRQCRRDCGSRFVGSTPTPTTRTHTHTDRTPTHAYRTHGTPSPDVCQSACFCTHACARVPGQPLNAHTRAPSPRGREQEIVSVRACKLKVNGSSEIIWLTRAGAYYAIARFCHTQDLRSMELSSEIALSAPYPMHRLLASFSLTRDYFFLYFLPASC